MDFLLLSWFLVASLSELSAAVVQCQLVCSKYNWQLLKGEIVLSLYSLAIRGLRRRCLRQVTWHQLRSPQWALPSETDLERWGELYIPPLHTFSHCFFLHLLVISISHLFLLLPSHKLFILLFYQLLCDSSDSMYDSCFPMYWFFEALVTLFQSCVLKNTGSRSSFQSGPVRIKWPLYFLW